MQYFFEARCFRVGACTFVVGASENEESSGSSRGACLEEGFGYLGSIVGSCTVSNVPPCVCRA